MLSVFIFGQPFEGLNHPLLDFGLPFKFFAIRLSGYGNRLKPFAKKGHSWRMQIFTLSINHFSYIYIYIYITINHHLRDFYVIVFVAKY